MRELEVNRNGELVFGGCDTVSLAREYGTPLYVVNEDYIVERCREIRETFLEKYPGARAVFASKALQTLEVCRIVTREGLGLDTVSAAEIYTAIKAGADPENIIFHGNNKTPDEIEFAVKSNVGRFVVDNEYELHLIDEISARLGKKTRIQLRITPGVDSHTHKYIATASIDSKFGISKLPEIRNRIIGFALDSENIELMGFHFHVGSQLQEEESHLLALDELLKLISEVRRDLGYTIRELNLGGGFGVRYVDGEADVAVKDFTDPMMKRLIAFCKAEGMDVPVTYIEPGRWIVANAGITLYTAGSIKEIPEIKNYLAIDGGMPDNPRFILYQAQYEAVNASRASLDADKKFSIVGKCCESGDVITEGTMLPKETESGDIICVFSTGAYNYTMASNYNRLPRPAMVMVKGGVPRLTVRRETWDDMLAREI